MNDKDEIEELVHLIKLAEAAIETLSRYAPGHVYPSALQRRLNDALKKHGFPHRA